MSLTKDWLDSLTQELVSEYKKRNPAMPCNDDVEDLACNAITGAPEADNLFDEPWVYDWLKTKKV